MLLLIITPASEAQPSVSQRSFAVKDAIELNSITSVEGDLLPGNPVSLPSESGRWMVIRTRQASLRSNELTETLRVFGLGEIEKYLTGSRLAPPAGAIVFSQAVRDERRLIRGLRWINDHELAFVGEASDGTSQIFSVDAVTAQRRQITHVGRDVTAFNIVGDEVMFYAVAPADKRDVIHTEHQNLLGLLFWDRDSSLTPIVEAWRTSRSHPIEQRLNIPKERLRSNRQLIAISPSGKLAVALVPATDAPKTWAAYRGFRAVNISSDPTSEELTLRTRYVIVNLTDGSYRPLLDAPSATDAAHLMVAFWTSDQRVIVTGTYLPLNVTDRAQYERRRARPAIAEVDIDSGAAQAIYWEAESTDAAAQLSALRVRGVRWLGRQGELEIESRDKENMVYVRHDGAWVHQGGTTSPTLSVTLVLRQGLNERPRLFAAGTACRCEKMLFDPSPKMAEFTFGSTSAFRWRDKFGNQWVGGLVLPPDFRAGTRYPVVIQTHGFFPEEFLVNGPGGYTTAMSAQALANAGIVVLQAPDYVGPAFGSADEAPQASEEFLSAARELVRAGVADEAKLGLTLWSRTGLHGIYLLAMYPHVFEAADIADASWWGYLLDLTATNYPTDWTRQIWAVSGGTPSANGVAQWITKNPLYEVPRAVAAIRLEANSPGSLVQNWELYSLLQKARHAVDLVYFPNGSHVLMKPDERLASQGGNVDWFRFWLQGHERTDPVAEAGETAATLARQYQRWEGLCDMRIEQHRDRPALCVHSKSH